MNSALKDKTNDNTPTMKKEPISEKETVLRYIKSVESTTKDYNLKYDLTKCIEILEGKENQEFIDLKSALEDVIAEKEELFREKCELAVELDYMKSREKRHKKIREQD